MIKYAVIGRGKIADQYIEGAKLSGRFELAAVYSREFETGEQYAKKHGVTKVYTQLNELILFGMPNNIKASASYLKNGADGSGSAIFEYDTFSVILSYSKVGQSMAPSEIVGDKGSIVIDRIGLYMGAYLVQKDERISLYDEEVKEKLMSYEATAFAKYIVGEELEEYDANSQLCLAVHSCMDEIKRVAGIKYS